MNLRPLRDRIVIEPIERVKSEVIQVVMTERDNMGIVVAAGPEAQKHLKEGEFIRYGTMGNDEYLKYQEYFVDNKRYLIMSWKVVCFVQ
jgi:co-chaperonin GroES (HSP10)